MNNTYLRLQFIVFSLVAASFTNIYITQPVLPILQKTFSVDMVVASFSVSAVIFGIALANLPFGFLADRFLIQPIILTGGIMVAVSGLICAVTTNIWILIAARFLQGLFIPSLTTCLAAYLAKSLPLERLNVVMGSYVAATVLGGLCGRLLGGWIHPPSHWRYAFVTAATLTLLATFIAVRGLPQQIKSENRETNTIGYLSLLKRWDILRIYLCALSSFAIFSSVFNYLPYRLTATPFNFTTQMATLLYLAYVVGVFIGPTAGNISNRMGSGNTLLIGTILSGAALLALLGPFIVTVVVGLIALCAGFFAVHAAAVGSLNRKLSYGQGRANALYVMFYYLGGWFGITITGFVYQQGGWGTFVTICLLILVIPISVAIKERNERIDHL